MDPLAAFWAEILSRDPSRTQQAYTLLNDDEQLALVAHLQRMVREEGWHPEQVASAQAALDVLDAQAEDQP